MARKGKAAGKVDPETMARQQRCLDLAVRGLSYCEIAEHEGYSGESGARQAVHAALRRAATDAAEVVRPLMIARAEKLWEHGYAVMLEGRDEQDIDKFLKGASAADRALGRLMSLHGLDRVPAVKVSMEGMPDLDRLKREMLQLLDGGETIEGEVVSEDAG
ncbi:hypothetical protein NDR87_31675 [Nocardia sp. CDC159]|uniref:Terminase small subunit n=1 Tax=Nocardia pulmonis TaxID=2951408 RepID=A0A9X2ECK0_9NOCA|nr:MULTISPECIES: hypothetical protein [Nocardia]MCM6777890.1 hypothetical protein [Nocardia pulmonis]MCM6790939.1 hypothetical protein [Nocardia sp. CDC159]